MWKREAEDKVSVIDVRLNQPLLTLQMGEAMGKECRLPLESRKGNKMDSPLEP